MKQLILWAIIKRITESESFFFKMRTRGAFSGSLAALLIVGLLVLEVCNVKPTYRKSCAANLLMLSDLTLDPLLQGQTRIVKLKNAYNSLIIGPRGLGCQTNL